MSAPCSAVTMQLVPSHRQAKCRGSNEPVGWDSDRSCSALSLSRCFSRRSFRSQSTVSRRRRCCTTQSDVREADSCNGGKEGRELAAQPTTTGRAAAVGMREAANRQQTAAAASAAAKEAKRLIALPSHRPSRSHFSHSFIATLICAAHSAAHVSAHRPFDPPPSPPPSLLFLSDVRREPARTRRR